MEMEPISNTRQDSKVLIRRAWEWLDTLLGQSKAKVANVAKGIIKLGQDDPRRITHSIKVGVALTLVSILYYSRPLYDGFGAAGMWAVLTVVVVFEFTVGGTLSKSLNRGFATLAACGLGVGAQHFARLFGERGEPIVLGILVFLLATIFTFTRFVPQVKARYDYGVLVFILTFSLVSLSGYRIEELLVFAHQRLLTILIGGATCVLVSIGIFPVWAGEDLHRLVASNIEKLANYLECVGNQYEECTEISSANQSSFLQEYKSVLGSKSTEDILANLARWEPRHGRFSYSHPWKQYLKIGSLSRQCAYQIEALTGYMINSKLQGCPREFEIRIQESCKTMCEESSKALKSLASSIRTMTSNSKIADSHVENSKIAMKDLKVALKTCSLDPADLLEIVPAATVASILIEIVHCVEKLRESVQELSELAHFKDIGDTVQIIPKKSQLLIHLKPNIEELNGHEHVIVVEIDKGTTKDRVNIGEIGTNLANS